MCNEYDELISKAIDHEISKEEEEKLVAHLKTCERCQQAYEDAMQLKDYLGQIEQEELPEHFHQDLMSKVTADKNTNKNTNKNINKNTNKKKPLWQMYGPIAACLIVGSALFYQITEMGLRPNTSKSTEMADRANYEAPAAEAPVEEMAPAAEAPSGQETGGSSVDSYPAARNSQGAIETAAPGETAVAQWTITSDAPDALKKEMIKYLDEHQYMYEQADGNLKITIMGDDTVSIDEWLISQGAQVNKENEEENAAYLLLTFVQTISDKN